MREYDIDGYNNFARIVKYIQGTIGIQLILSIIKSGNIKWYVGAAFSVQNEMRIHIGGFMTMGTGGDYVHFIKKKLNSNISSEAELFGVDYALTQVIWTQ